MSVEMIYGSDVPTHMTSPLESADSIFTEVDVNTVNGDASVSITPVLSPERHAVACASCPTSRIATHHSRGGCRHKHRE